MSILDLQSMETPKEEATGDVELGGGGGGSRASLLLCGDSSLSVTTCH
ncbi:lanthionine-containing peptide SapB [Streptomyces spiroverticillatus]|uniref:Lanthionine-containing peptide SapB n=1 Tax=Streptomyces finlayi TaxID=67296 RepID=A0A919CCF5_9ACTN|nr:SapB/AmfS family lanthipeptide [Streptomyces finlayi]GHA22848.1 lanthionine-containing peptide SapB [Streptomyces spiroverticillatus]GHD04636.1 lanthionine-containing peptide SapB [Streptomyces finlayi]